jgi:hypothetical protein
MSVLKSKDDREIIINCICGCDDSVHIKIDKEDYECYCIITYLNGNFYRDQKSVFNTFIKKLKKIWAIIRNKDYYYSDIILNEEEFEEFRDYINQIK